MPRRAKPPHREWNAPPSNRERDSHAGTRPKQRYDRWDGPRGRQRSPGRHWDKSWDQAGPQERQWERSRKPKRATLMGIQWKLQRKATDSP